MEQLTFDQYIAENFPLCACGCGEPTPLARSTDRKAGLVKGQPTRFIKGHGRRKRIDGRGRQCGTCGEYKPWDDFHVSRTTRYGHVTICKPCMAVKSAASQPARQERRVRMLWQAVAICECGCGEPTALAGRTDPEHGWVKFQPLRYRDGHWRRGKFTADREESRQARLARSRKYYAANPEKAREAARAWRIATGYRRPPGSNMKANYGITYAQYCGMVIAQCGACAVCGAIPSEDPDADKRVNKLFVDHDHETGQVRGLLCQMCNLMLGQADDDPARLRGGADYLDEWSKCNEPALPFQRRRVA